MLEYRFDDLSPEDLHRERDVYGDLTQRTRTLIDAVLRTEVDVAEAQEVAAQLDALSERLLAKAREGSYGVAIGSDGTVRNYGNAVVGVRNPVAPPLEVQRSEEGRAWADFRLGAQYEGPPGLVHGGVTALILDQICGEAAAAGGKPGMTGTLTMRYRRGTPLGDLRAEAWIDRTEGVKTFVIGRMADEQGETTVECEGIFILPRWARKPVEEISESKPLRFE